MRKRILSVLLILSLILSFCACGGGSGDGDVEITLDYGYDDFTETILNKDFLKYSVPEGEFYPQRDGHIFEGWFYKNEPYSGKTSKKITVAAKWTKMRFTVSFKDNLGNTLGNYLNVAYNTKITLDDYTEKTGYLFEKWTLGGDDYEPSDEFIVFGNTTFTGIFSANQYTASFISEDLTELGYNVTGQISPISISFDQKITLPSDGFLCEGQTLIGWYFDQKIYNLGEEFTLTVDKHPVFTAVWTDEE